MPSFLSRLFGSGAVRAPREEKTSRAAKLLAMHSIGLPQWTPRTYAALTREGYERNAVCHRAVRMIAEAAASVPWLMFEGRTEIIEHPLLDLVARPNPGDTSVSFLESVASNLLLYGNAYIEAAFVDEQLREIYSLRPDRMSVTPGKNGWPSAYVYTVMGDQIRYDMRGEGIEPILHIKFFNPLDDVYGFPPLAAAQVALDTHNAASFWNKALLDNSARPSGALVYAGPDGAHLTDEQFTRLKEELEENFSGAVNAGRPLLLEGGLDWKALSLSPKDMDFTEAKAAAARDIALAFGIPPLLLGLPGDNTFRNYQEANRAFWRQTVIPLVARLQKSFHAWMQPGYEPFRFDYDADRIDALAEERAMEWKRVGDASFLTLDEQREAVGYGALPKGASVAGAAPGAPKRVGKAPSLRYSPDQPRVPAGSREGGRWTSEGGGGDTPSDQAAPDSQVDAGDDASVSLAADEETGGYRVNLLNETDRGGDAFEKHVGKSDEFLLNRIRTERYSGLFVDVGLQAAGSFSSLVAANKLVNATLSASSAIVDAVAKGVEGGAVIERFFDSPTGKQAYANSGRSQPYIRDTFGVRVVIRHDDQSPNGFTVVTAFPINEGD